MKCWVYVIRSNYDRSLYVGQTRNVSARIAEHNAGKCRFTKGHLPWQLVYKEELNSRSKAVKRERFLKSGVGREELRNILPCGVMVAQQPLELLV